MKRGTVPRSLALVMVVRNEEDALSRCLESVDGVVDEIVIVDTGSTDRTKEIAASFGAKVLDHPWEEDFSAARNTGIEAAESDWILTLDADEELLGGTENLHFLLGDRYNQGFRAQIVAAPDRSSVDEATDRSSVLRLFKRKASIRYQYPVYEQVTVDDDRVSDSELSILHFGPFVEQGKSLESHNRNMPLLHKAIDQYPDDGYSYALLAFEYLGAGDNESCLRYGSEAVRRDVKGSQWGPANLRNLAYSTFKSGQTDQALNALYELEQRFPDYTDLFFVHGSLLHELGHSREAMSTYLHCLAMGDPPATYWSLGGTGSWRAKARLTRAEEGIKVLPLSLEFKDLSEQ